MLTISGRTEEKTHILGHYEKQLRIKLQNWSGDKDTSTMAAVRTWSLCWWFNQHWSVRLLTTLRPLLFQQVIFLKPLFLAIFEAGVPDWAWSVYWFSGCKDVGRKFLALRLSGDDKPIGCRFITWGNFTNAGQGAPMMRDKRNAVSTMHLTFKSSPLLGTSAQGWTEYHFTEPTANKTHKFSDLYLSLGFPGGTKEVKNPPSNVGDLRDRSSIPGWVRSTGGGHGNPSQYSCFRIPWTRGAWGYSPEVTRWTQLSNLARVHAYLELVIEWRLMQVRHSFHQENYYPLEKWK